MSNIKRIRIEMDSLVDDEQIKLWMNLLNFADKELPSNKDLIITIEKVRT